MRVLSKVLTGSMIAAAALAVSACGPKSTDTNTSVTDVTTNEGTDTMTDNMGAVDTATDNGVVANDTTTTTDTNTTTTTNAM
jgi:hypothetical protein